MAVDDHPSSSDGVSSSYPFALSIVADRTSSTHAKASGLPLDRGLSMAFPALAGGGPPKHV